jgi:hypothetical protein
MDTGEMQKLIRTPIFRAGLVLQGISGTLIAGVPIGIHLGWIDYIGLGLETPLDERSFKLDALSWGVCFLTLAFASGFAFYAVALHRQRKAPPSSLSNGGSVARLGNSGITEGPPSVG